MAVSIYDGTQVGADGRRHPIGDVPSRAPRHGCSEHDQDELSVYVAGDHTGEPDVDGDGD